METTKTTALSVDHQFFRSVLVEGLLTSGQNWPQEGVTSFYKDLLGKTLTKKASGIKLKTECVDAFKEMKLRKSYPFVIFKIDDKFQNIEIAEKGKTGETFDDFRTKMIAPSETEGRYAVYDMTECEDENSKNKTGELVFVTMVPDHLKVKPKMLYASSKSVIKGAFEGIQLDMQINDPGELTLENMKSSLGSKAKK